MDHIFRKKENFIILNAEMSNDHKVFLSHKSLVKRVGKFKAKLAIFFFKKRLSVLTSLAFSVRKTNSQDPVPLQKL